MAFYQSGVLDKRSEVELNKEFQASLEQGQIVENLSIGDSKDDIMAEFGEAEDEVSSRNFIGEKYGNLYIFYYDDIVKNVQIEPSSITITNRNELVDQLDEPTWEGTDEAGGLWSINYEVGEYQLWVDLDSEHAGGNIASIRI